VDGILVASKLSKEKGVGAMSAQGMSKNAKMQKKKTGG
jgi:hypothetical protein